MGQQLLAFIFHSSLTIIPVINILAISNKGRSRIGSKLTRALVEQNHHDKIFVVIYGTSECRWIMKHGDPNFRIID